MESEWALFKASIKDGSSMSCLKWVPVAAATREPAGIDTSSGRDCHAEEGGLQGLFVPEDPWSS